MAIQPTRIGILLAALAAPAAVAQAGQSLDRVLLRGNIPAAVAQAEPVGRPEAGQPMERMLLSLRLAPEAQARLDTLLGKQQDPGSPLYHQWLTPEAFGERFGPAQADLDAITGWLRDNDFTVDEVAAGRTSVTFSGTVQQVEAAFRTLILDYRLAGRAFHANAVEPSIPGALAGTVQGVVSLHNLPRKAMNAGLQPLYTAGGGSHYLAPGDFARIYDVQPLYGAGITGAGVNLAIVGRTHIPVSDIAGFRSQFGLPANAPSVVVNGADPGDLGGGEDVEADLDVEWSGAVARNANILFVVSQSTGSTDGVDLSAQYIVNHNLAAVMSTSFGQCEASMGSAEIAFYNNLWAQAAAQGITALVASGDSGAAGCSQGGASAGSGQGVSGLASSPYDLAVGGTEFNDASGAYWSASTAADGSSALGYIPEQAWNESGSVSGGSGLWAGGGGASSIYPKPSWQAAPGVPADSRRDLPDVSLAAAGHDGYLIEYQGGLGAVGGTSASSPAFAGLMALVVQKTGQRQGNANPALYRMASAQFSGTGPAVFHDILTGSNSVPGAAGFQAGAGYDLATGLGSVDAQALVNNWSTTGANKVDASINAPSVAETISSGATVAFSGTGSDSSATAGLSCSWSFGDGATATGATASHTFSNTGTASVTDTVTFTVKDSTGVSASATRAITVTPAPRNSLTAAVTAPAASVTVASGASVAFAGSAKDSSATAALSCSWSFGDGATATGATASHTFSNTGTASVTDTVTFTVKDSTGVSASATRAVTVTPAPRNSVTVAITSPAASVTVASGASVAFAGSAKDSSATSALSYAWSFGDGTTATSASASHAFSNTGTASVTDTVTLTVRDSTGITASATRAVTVLPAPRNTLTVAVATPAASATVASCASVAFAASAKDSSASAALSYTWTFGDGATATGASASHAFSNTGAASVTDTVTLTVKDSTGITASATRAVTVTPAPATLTAVISSPSANITVASGSVVQLTGVAQDSSPNAVLNYSWAAAGPGATLKPVAMANGVTLTSVCTAGFNNPTGKPYSVVFSFIATDNRGVRATASRTVTVLPGSATFARAR